MSMWQNSLQLHSNSIIYCIKECEYDSAKLMRIKLPVLIMLTKLFITMSHKLIYLRTSISSAVYLCPCASHACGLINGWGLSRKGLIPSGKCVLVGGGFGLLLVDLILHNGFVKGSLNASALKRKGTEKLF